MKQVQGKLTDVFAAKRKDIIDAIFNHVAAQPGQRIAISRPTRIYRVDANLCVELEEISELYLDDELIQGLHVVGKYMEMPDMFEVDPLDINMNDKAFEDDVNAFDMDIENLTLDEIYHVITDLDEADATE